MMNAMESKFIKTDIEQGLKYLKVGIMNALAEIESGASEDITLDGPIALKLIIDCAEERGWKEDPDMDWDWTNGWEVDYSYYMITPNNQPVCICGSLLCGNSVSLTVTHDDER